MFKIQPKFLTFAQLLEKRLFRIPRYQRAYSWRHTEREDMFNDIRKLKGKPENLHFMATVVGLYQSKVPIGSDDYDVIDIVDGQQRLTTLVILLKVIAEKIASLLTDTELLRDAGGNVINLNLFPLPNETDEDMIIPKAHLERELQELQELLVKQDELSLILLQTNHDRSQYFANFLRKGTSPPFSEAKTVADRELLRAIHEGKIFCPEMEQPHRTFATIKESALVYIS